MILSKNKITSSTTNIAVRFLVYFVPIAYLLYYIILFYIWCIDGIDIYVVLVSFTLIIIEIATIALLEWIDRGR
ncbi:hypothetical protein CH06BL_15040 [Chromobacterium haemolyticum]|nr:hypothetical protein CH06BL_15040 [Chromobacterium haemolyticum]